MPEELIIRHCSPTLAGIKTGNLFSCAYTDKKELFNDVRDLNNKLGPKGLRLVMLRYGNGRALIYLYRPQKLKSDLSDAQAAELLKERGYSTNRAEECVVQLAKRLRCKDEFPHEIGLFLGYPIEDVCGFIEHKGTCEKCTGCWKVYGNVQCAQKKFAQYKKCTSVYCKQWDNGKSIERLTVAG